MGWPFAQPCRDVAIALPVNVEFPPLVVVLVVASGVVLASTLSNWMPKPEVGMPYQEARNIKDDKGQLLIQHPLACVDCHEPKTMALRVTRPGFIAGIKALKAKQGVPDYEVLTFNGIAAPKEPPDSLLTRRELQVLTLLALGVSSRELAERLGVSQATIRNHVQSILGKLGVHSRLEAVALVRR